jgi:hypothetical protein
MSKTEKKTTEWREIGVPKDLVRALMAAETKWTFDSLEGIIEAPTMLLDGSILDEPGYNKETGLFYDPRNMPEMAEIRRRPTAEDALTALAVLDDVLDEFSFADDEGSAKGESQSAAIAAILAAGVRRVLPMCPAFLIDAPGQSNGKTLLADLIATIWTGRGAGATTWAGDSAEQRKVITSILVAGDLVVNFDNVTAAIGGPAICAVMTAQENFKDRLLGSTKMLDLPPHPTGRRLRAPGPSQVQAVQSARLCQGTPRRACACRANDSARLYRRGQTESLDQRQAIRGIWPVQRV